MGIHTIEQFFHLRAHIQGCSGLNMAILKKIVGQCELSLYFIEFPIYMNSNTYSVQKSLLNTRLTTKGDHGWSISILAVPLLLFEPESVPLSG